MRCVYGLPGTCARNSTSSSESSESWRANGALRIRLDTVGLLWSVTNAPSSASCRRDCCHRTRDHTSSSACASFEYTKLLGALRKQRKLAKKRPSRLSELTYDITLCTWAVVLAATTNKHGARVLRDEHCPGEQQRREGRHRTEDQHCNANPRRLRLHLPMSNHATACVVCTGAQPILLFVSCSQARKSESAPRTRHWSPGISSYDDMSLAL